MTGAVWDDGGPPPGEELFVTAAELRCLREYLGLPPVWLADRLGVRERTLHRWEHGAAPIPDGVADEILALADETAQYVLDLVTTLGRQLADGGTVQLHTFRTDEDHRELGGPQGSAFPASWHRAAAARVVEQLDGVELLYAGEPSS